MARKVKVRKVPGFVDGFTATVIPGMDEVPAVDDRGPVAVISTEAGELLVVPSSALEDIEEV